MGDDQSIPFQDELVARKSPDFFWRSPGTLTIRRTARAIGSPVSVHGQERMADCQAKASSRVLQAAGGHADGRTRPRTHASAG